MSDGSRFNENVKIFAVDNSSSAHVDNRKKDILIFGKGPTDGLDYTTLIAEAEYYINFCQQQNKFCLCLYYNESNKFLLMD